MSSSSSSLLLPYSFNTRDYTLSLSARHTTNTDGTAMFPRVLVDLQVKHECSWRTRPAGSNGILTVDRTLPFGSAVERSFHIDLCDILIRPSAEQAVGEMLSMMCLDTKECNYLGRFLSTFTHYAAIEAGKKGVGKLHLVLTIGVEIVYLYDEGEAIAAAIRKSVGRSYQTENMETCSPCSPYAGEERQLPESCPVCLDDFTFSDAEELESTPCWHVFHKDCIRGWLERSKHCPLCRFHVLGIKEKGIKDE